MNFRKMHVIGLLLCSQILSASEKQLRLHFDINKTIIAMDAVQGKGLEETINGILAEFTFAQWDGANEQSYYAYITDLLAAQYPQLSRADEAFKAHRAVLLREFPIFLQQYPMLLANYEYDKSRMLDILDKDEIVIFPSFFKAIVWLEAHYPHKYAIYLRTFGQDLPEVVPAVEHATSLRFAGQGIFQGTRLSLVEREDMLYEFFVGASVQHYAIQDDYAYWKSRGFRAVGGKLFPLDPTHPRIVSIFFDDNANDPDKPIICPIGQHDELYDTLELLKTGHIVAVNPKEAILDEDYFIKKIQAIL